MISGLKTFTMMRSALEETQFLEKKYGELIPPAYSCVRAFGHVFISAPKHATTSGDGIYLCNKDLCTLTPAGMGCVECRCYETWELEL
ncbi:hypothetical protein CHS0354_041875 [Potamilus streckersoni]|uniref:Uncharacterized protein n=1 Tax=Potamilus streckersoni TaxID=2493646 RepID=A0AAE0SSW7_9BIVA|nr:hypothetical protein CHS0354_041875 [Potamilus streckersoni]